MQWSPVGGPKRGALLGLAALLVCPAFAQDNDLTILEAVQMAKNRNGTVRAAIYDVEAARSRARASFGAFLPTVTPSYTYDYRRSQTYTGRFGGVSKSSDHVTELAVNWRVLDAGQREWSYLASKELADAAVASASQTLRNVLFTVNQQFYDTLRSQELLKVFSAQVERAGKIVDQTQAQIDVGAAAKKDILQARADFLNAQVDRLTAENQASVNQASLKATIGLPGNENLGTLVAPQAPEQFPEPIPLEQAIQMGLDQRPDLIALRRRLEAQSYFVRSADREKGLTWTLDASYNRAFTPDVSDFRGLTFLVSYPLFDGNRLREAARQEKLAYQAQEADLIQAEREARADIESAHAILRQDIERVRSAKLAVEAAKLNYEAALESQRLGAEGTSIITVLTAQVSLVTAESNYVDALYDYYISDARLKQVTGQPLPGE